MRLLYLKLRNRGFSKEVARVDIKMATEQYERWLGQFVGLDQGDLATKYKKMAAGKHEFLRGTFYRWAQQWPQECPQLVEAPTVLGVGDLHMDNFGTWHDAEARFVWGINDFDEACSLPYTSDLLRLATSLTFAIEDDALQTSIGDACEGLLDGYADGLENGKPLILAEDHKWLRDALFNRLRTPVEAAKEDAFEKFLDKMHRAPVVAEAIPLLAQETLRMSFPERESGPEIEYKVVRRQAGLGSLGRPRYTALVEDWCGGLLVREVKALAPSAQSWARPHGADSNGADSNGADPAILYLEVLKRAVRSLDPTVRVNQGWIARRLAADADKIEFKSLPQDTDQLRLLRSMGRETANIHGADPAQAARLREDLKRRTSQDKSWLQHAARQMAGVLTADFDAWHGGWKDWLQEWQP